MKKINILLATYNGEQYISQQLESLLSNIYLLDDCDCSILISDDNSTDSTLAAIEKYINKYEYIRFLDNKKKGSAQKNFEYLIKHADINADYVFFCDQDDFWLPEKMKLFFDRFIALEKTNHNLPIMLHSDLVVVDSQLFPTEISMFNSQKLNRNPSFNNLIVQNSVTGCVCAINQNLLQLLQQCKFEYSIMHDWYAALIASSKGIVEFIPKSTILYRQHDKNEVGAKKLSLWTLIVNIRDTVRKLVNSQKSIINTKKQAISLLSEDYLVLPSETVKILKDYVDSFDGSIVGRFSLFCKGVRKHSYIRNIAFFVIYVFCAKKLIKFIENDNEY